MIRLSDFEEADDEDEEEEGLMYEEIDSSKKVLAKKSCHKL